MVVLVVLVVVLVVLVVVVVPVAQSVLVAVARGVLEVLGCYTLQSY